MKNNSSINEAILGLMRVSKFGDIDGEDIVLYNDMFDCIEKMNYYNENEEERERIAHNGMLKVLHNYTQIQIVDKLINAYESFNNGSSRITGK